MDKKCTRCGNEKQISDFQIRKASKDGLTASCKDCLKKYDSLRNMLPHRVEARNKYQKTSRGMAVCKAMKERWADRNKEKRAAHLILGNAIKYGRITRKPCEICGSNIKIHGHHDDYSKPLDVRWLCPKHHKQIHANLLTVRR